MISYVPCYSDILQHSPAGTETSRGAQQPDCLTGESHATLVHCCATRPVAHKKESRRTQQRFLACMVAENIKKRFARCPIKTSNKLTVKFETAVSEGGGGGRLQQSGFYTTPRWCHVLPLYKLVLRPCGRVTHPFRPFYAVVASAIPTVLCSEEFHSPQTRSVHAWSTP